MENKIQVFGKGVTKRYILKRGTLHSQDKDTMEVNNFRLSLWCKEST